MTPCENAAAVKELLSWTEAPHYSEVIEELFEGWLCSEYADNIDLDKRSFYLATYKEMKKFLGKIKAA